jgi:pimeloyl-ACP methyl ester carboxylesterase
MATYSVKRIVLVHGAGHGAWCWEEVAPLLSAAGFDVVAIDLPGLGADRTPPRDVTLDGYRAAVVDAVVAAPAPVTLVGHSMGGIPISLAAETEPQWIERLIYLAALLPKDGERLTDLVAADQGPSATPTTGPWNQTDALELDPLMAREIFYNTCDVEKAQRAAARLRPQATRPMYEPARLSAARWGSVPKTYIVCEQDQALPPGKQHWFCERMPEVRKLSMNTDHSPFYSDPQGLAALIAAEARTT